MRCLARRDLRAPNAPTGLRSNRAEQRRRERRHKERKLEGRDTANLEERTTQRQVHDEETGLSTENPMSH